MNTITCQHSCIYPVSAFKAIKLIWVNNELHIYIILIVHVHEKETSQFNISMAIIIQTRSL